MDKTATADSFYTCGVQSLPLCPRRKCEQPTEVCFRCQVPAQTPLEKLKDLEEGASSYVFTAKDNKLGTVVVKRRKQGWKEERWARELKVLQILKAEPCRDIVIFHGEIKWSGESTFVFEYLEGGDLFMAMQREDQNGILSIVTFGEDIVRIWARCLLRALAWIHARRILHRDIKTENLLLTLPIGPVGQVDKGSRIKLIDFGCSSILREGEDFIKGEYNTIDCAPYEASDIIDGRCMRASDIHPAGEVLFQLFEGNPAFDCPEYDDGKLIPPKVRYQKKREILEARKPGEVDLPFKKTPIGAQTLITSMLRFDPQDRPSAELLLAEDPWLQIGKDEEEQEMLREAAAGKPNSKQSFRRRFSTAIGDVVKVGKKKLSRSSPSGKTQERVGKSVEDGREDMKKNRA